jgi:hypothetical protein
MRTTVVTMFMMVMHQLPRLVCWTNVPVKTFDPPPGEVHCHHLRRAPSWSTPALVEFVDDAAVNSDDDAEMERSQVKQEVQTDSTQQPLVALFQKDGTPFAIEMTR